jgi:epoxyqueuosine reductase QueG
MVLEFLKSKKAKLKDADRKRKKDKIKAYRKLQEEMAGDEYKASTTKDKKNRKIKRDSINKQYRKSGEIAKYMPDIAGDIKASGDPVLGKYKTLQTKYRHKKDAEAAGVKFKAKGGMIIAPKSGSAHYKSKQNAKSIAKKYFKGGIN